MGHLKLLLDTHCWIWLKAEPDRLPSPLRRRLARDPSKLVLSTVSVLEIAIKQASGRLTMEASPAELVADILDDGVDALEISIAHALRMAALPSKHKDLFDRLLVAQALVERLRLVSADANILAFDVPSIDARR